MALRKLMGPEIYKHIIVSVLVCWEVQLGSRGHRSDNGISVECGAIHSQSTECTGHVCPSSARAGTHLCVMRLAGVEPGHHIKEGSFKKDVGQENGQFVKTNSQCKPNRSYHNSGY